DKDQILFLENYLTGTKPVIATGNTATAGNACAYKLAGRTITDNGFYALMLQNTGGKIKADAFDPKPSNAGEIASTKDFIAGLKAGKLNTDNEIYQYVNSLFSSRTLFDATASKDALTFSFKEDKKESQTFLRQKGNILYMVNVKRNLFTEGMEFAYYYLITK
ncbi:MAG: hypothetical protein IAF38_02600, partial [Bacteroidia bacterium]|nr:hypothetical protein [Bacteroidia bacterium]